MFDPFEARGRNGPGEFDLGPQGQCAWDAQRNQTPMVHGDNGGAGWDQDTGLPSIPPDQANPPYKYGYGNSVFIAGGQGTQQFFT